MSSDTLCFIRMTGAAPVSPDRACWTSFVAWVIGLAPRLGIITATKQTKTSKCWVIFFMIKRMRMVVAQ